MRALGIDPGLAIVGFGVVDSDGRRHQAVRYGVIRTEAGLPLAQRLDIIGRDVAELLETFRPDAAAIEQLYWGHNVTTGMQVAHSRGIILRECWRAGVPISEYTPSQVKQAVTGYGKAEKIQVMEMVRTLLKLPAVPHPDDAADALAVALAHIQ